MYRLNNRHRSEKETVLLIEDNKPMSYLLESILSDKYQVQAFQSANQALLWLSCDNTPDIIVSDINMSHMDGIEFVRNVSVLRPSRHIPVIFLSGYDQKDLAPRLMRVDYDAYIRKPFNPMVLLDTLQDVARLAV